MFVYENYILWTFFSKDISIVSLLVCIQQIVFNRILTSLYSAVNIS